MALSLIFITNNYQEMAAKKIKIDNAYLKFKKQSSRREKKRIRCSMLIVCEGTKTEPEYFRAIAKKEQGVTVYDIEVRGLGRGAKNVVEKAISLKDKNSYDRVWAVFDKDDLAAKVFNDAILMCKNNGIEAAWSNEAFELWYLYHFQDITTGVSRKNYEEKISVAVNPSPKYTSDKNTSTPRKILTIARL